MSRVSYSKINSVLINGFPAFGNLCIFINKNKNLCIKENAQNAKRS